MPTPGAVAVADVGVAVDEHADERGSGSQGEKQSRKWTIVREEEEEAASHFTQTILHCKNIQLGI